MYIPGKANDSCCIYLVSLLLSLLSSYNPFSSHISSSVRRIFDRPVFPLRCSVVNGLRFVTRLSIAFHSGCSSSSPSILVAAVPTVSGWTNLRSSRSSCSFLHSTGAEDAGTSVPFSPDENRRRVPLEHRPARRRGRFRAVKIVNMKKNETRAL